MAECAEAIICEVQKYSYLYDITDKNYKNIQLKKKAWVEISAKLGLEINMCQTKWTSIRDRYQREKRAVNNDKGKSGAAATPKKKKWNLFPLLWYLDRPQQRTCSNITNMEEISEVATETLSDCESDDDTNFDRCQEYLSQEMFHSNQSLVASPPPSNVSENRKRTVSSSLSQDEASSIQSTSKGKKKRKTVDEFEEKLLIAVEKNCLLCGDENIEEDEFKNFCLSLVPIFKRLPPKKASMLKLKVLEECTKIEFDD